MLFTFVFPQRQEKAHKSRSHAVALSSGARNVPLEAPMWGLAVASFPVERPGFTLGTESSPHPPGTQSLGKCHLGQGEESWWQGSLAVIWN